MAMHQMHRTVVLRRCGVSLSCCVLRSKAFMRRRNYQPRRRRPKVQEIFELASIVVSFLVAECLIVVFDYSLAVHLASFSVLHRESSHHFL